MVDRFTFSLCSARSHYKCGTRTIYTIEAHEALVGRNCFNRASIASLETSEVLEASDLAPYPLPALQADAGRYRCKASEKCITSRLCDASTARTNTSA